jgi:putative alpha-1,2-mannosidase
MIKLLGGKDKFTAQLDSFFAIKALNPNKHLGQEAMIGQYAHGNEPSHHIAYLYAFSNTPYKGRELIRQICNQFYRDTPDGMIGNDDCGQMSAWYIFSTLGFYPVNPANGEFVIGIPQVKKAIIKLTNQKQLSIATQNMNKKMSAEFDDKIIISPCIKFNWLKSGGSLVFKGN